MPKHVCGNPCMIDRCGHPCYQTQPCCPPHDCRKCCAGHGCMLSHSCELPPRYNNEYDQVTGVNDDKFCYTAYSRVLPKANTIQCYFPAKDQLFCGVYKLVVVAMMYEPGWGRTDLHTYTMDYGEVLNLVDDATGASGDIVLSVDEDKLEDTNILAIRIKTDHMYLYGNQNIRLGEKDTRNHTYQIEVDLENGSTLTYTPSNWPYEKLTFTTSKTGVVTVDENGLIKALDTDDTQDTYITVAAKNNNLSAGFTVTVVGGGYDYIGYLPVRPFSKNMEDDLKYGFDRTDQTFENPSQENYASIGVENVNLALLHRVEDLSDPATVQNDVDGQYLWIVTRQPISYAANVNPSSISGMTAATYIPLTSPMKKEGDERYYYCCPNPMKSNASTGGAQIYVKLKNASL